MAFGGLSFFGDLLQTVDRLHRHGRITDSQLAAFLNSRVPTEVSEAACDAYQRRPYLTLKLKGFPPDVRRELLTRYCPRKPRGKKGL